MEFLFLVALRVNVKKIGLPRLIFQLSFDNFFMFFNFVAIELRTKRDTNKLETRVSSGIPFSSCPKGEC